jgi:hypothetical protein
MEVKEVKGQPMGFLQFLDESLLPAPKEPKEAPKKNGVRYEIASIPYSDRDRTAR